MAGGYDKEREQVVIRLPSVHQIDMRVKHEIPPLFPVGSRAFFLGFIVGVIFTSLVYIIVTPLVGP